MKYHELQATTNKDRKRKGRGISAGQGKTAGRGTKGQGARTGKKLGATFMGGQGSLVQRIPKKKGFTSKRVPAQAVYLNELTEVKGASIDNMKLYEAGLITTPYHSVKLILRGEYKGKATVKTQGASQGVKDALKAAGGVFVKTAIPTLPASNKVRADKKAERAAKYAKSSDNTAAVAK